MVHVLSHQSLPVNSVFVKSIPNTRPRLVSDGALMVSQAMGGGQTGDTVLALLERWETLREQGTEVSAEELCRDQPECLSPVSQAIKSLKAVSAVLDSPAVEDEGEPPGVIASRYKPQRLLGHGGFGRVWVAFDEELRRDVAIKTPRVRGGMAGPLVDRFLAEARTVAGLRHPGIVPVHDVIREGERCYIVSEWIDGEDLARVLKAKRFSQAEIIAIGMRLAEVLEYAHTQGIVHRDIKPSNLLLDGQGRLRVCDFGIAAVMGGQGDRRLTLAYASPERLDEERVDPRSDIWSLGVVLFELATGCLPFEDSDLFRLRGLIRTAPVPDMPGILPGLASVIRKCLAKDPAERFQSASDARAALAKAGKEPADRRLGRTAAMVAALGAVLVVAQVIAFGWRPGKSPNLVFNGDFSEGNKGFNTSYIYSPDDIGLLQCYAILRNPQSGTMSPQDKGNFGDHTTGKGLMMVVNGSADANVVVWSQQVSIEPGKAYDFEMWVSSWHQANPAIVEVRFNGKRLGVVDAPVTTGMWVPLRARWESGDKSQVEIEIIDIRPEDIGSDFAIDDISLRPAYD